MLRVRRWLCLLPLTLLLSAIVDAGTPGSFRGKIVDGPHPAAEKGWIYVQARNGMVRRVEISHAQVEYDEDVPATKRLRNPQDAVKVGAEVRITAEQGSDGEWRASQVEILALGLTSAVSH
jgi:hypothetical protein